MPAPLVIGGIIAGAMSLIGSLVNSVVSNTVGMNQSKDLMDYQNNLQQQNVDAANRYNSPLEQMKRLDEAGLNPNLAISGISSGTSEVAKVNQSNRQVPFDVGLSQAAENYFRGMQMDYQRDVAYQQIQESKQRQSLLATQQLNELEDFYYLSGTRPTRIRQAEANVEHTLQSINESAQRVSYLQSQANQIEENIKLIQQKTGLTRQQIISERARPELIRNQARYYAEMRSTSAAQAEMYRSVAALNDQQIKVLIERVHEIQQHTSLMAAEESYKNWLKDPIGGINGKDAMNVVIQILRMIFND